MELAKLLAESRALYFDEGLTLKDGRPTPYFVNFGLFRTGRLVSELGRLMADFLMDTKTVADFDVLIGPSYKGSALAVSCAEALWRLHQIEKGYDYDRKEVKGHGEGSRDGQLFVTGALFDGARVLIIDDVATTMATKFDILGQLTREASKRDHSYYPAGVALYLDREQTTAVYDEYGQPEPGRKGQDAVKNFKLKTGLEVQTILGIGETIDFLHKERIPVYQAGLVAPLTDDRVEEFKRYVELYGV